MVKREGVLKRVFVGADFQCGHLVGLTPPEYQTSPDRKNPRKSRFSKIQKTLWDEFAKRLAPYKPFDIAILNGDLIDGKGGRSGSSELITADRYEQCEMAARVIGEIGAKVNLITYGTAYHTGIEEDWEDVIAGMVGAQEIGSHGFYNIQGLVFDCKHHLTSSSIPHGRLTPLAREILWNQMWSARGEQPRADILIRSHVHYFEQCFHEGCYGFITPSLQGMGTKFGARRCSGTVDFGFLTFDVMKNKEFTWSVERLVGKVQSANVLSL